MTTFTAILPAGIELPEETWLTARVRRHGNALEIAAEGTAISAQDTARAQALKKWLARCAAQPPSSLTDEELDDLRWQGLKEKFSL